MIESNEWRPAASIAVIKRRAQLFQQIRDFMQARAILEVDTPILSQAGNSDPYIHSLSLRHGTTDYYLHTSPEYCMKRLLAAGTGAIYQIAHVFRADDAGNRHLPEFCMLEWYRVGFDYDQLMDEVAEFIEFIGLPAPVKMTYQAAFETALNINPHTAKLETLRQLANAHGWQDATEDRHELLDFLYSTVVMKNKGLPEIGLIHDYPACMSALATLKKSDPAISERFELVIAGLEIANGFNELTDAKEQRARFENEQKQRKEKGLAVPPVDERFLSALAAGLPASAGVALGVDRLLMVLTGEDDINRVNSFSILNN